MALLSNTLFSEEKAKIFVPYVVTRPLLLLLLLLFAQHHKSPAIVAAALPHSTLTKKNIERVGCEYSVVYSFQ